MPELRVDLLTLRRDDGGLEIVDLLFDRLHRFDAAQAAAIAAGEAGIWAELARLFLVEGALAQTLREQQIHARVRGVPARAAAEAAPVADWSRAAAWPEADVGAWWRDGERLRRVAEERCAGREVLILRGFFTPERAEALAVEAGTLPFTRFETDLVRGSRHMLGAGELDWLQRFFADATTRHLLGALLGLSPPAETVINAWRVEPGDHFRAHVDGHHYAATFSVGLCRDWTAADGGAIAFGEPGPQGFEPRERWLPHAGDLCLFRPRQARWHAVEPVGDRSRLTVTGWWKLS